MTTSKHTRIAYHEAGHAVVARRLGVGISYVTMLPGFGQTAGVQTCSAAHAAGDAPEAFICGCEADAQVSLAGPIAEQLHRPIRTRLGEKSRMGFWESDIERAGNSLGTAEALRAGAVTIAEARHGGFEIALMPELLAARNASSRRLHEETRKLLEDDWPAVDRVATAFMERPFFNEEEIDMLIADRESVSC